MTYLEGLLDSLDKCRRTGFGRDTAGTYGTGVHKKTGRDKKRPHTPSKPHHYISSDGFDIYVGKNNHQNDRLTLKAADHNDIWLHTKNIPAPM